MKKITILLILIFATSCLPLSNRKWKIHTKEVVYYACFSLKHSKLILFTDLGLICRDLNTGKKEWINTEFSLYSPCVPVIMEDEIIVAGRKNMIYYIDISNGNYTKKHDVKDKAIVLKQRENLLYFITESRKNCILNELDLYSNKRKKIFDFKKCMNYGRISLVVFKNTIVVSAQGDNSSTLYSIDKNSGKLNWKKSLPNKIFPKKQNIVHYGGSIFFISEQADNKSRLVEIDIETGNLKNTVSIEDMVSSWISFDGSNILLRGEKLYVYNVQKKTIKSVIENFNLYATLSAGKILYDNGNSIFLYDIENKTNKEIYQLKNKERFFFFMENENILLSFANDIKETLANSKQLTYVLLKIK